MNKANALDFIESALEAALAEKQCALTLEGRTLDIADVASARGLLPLFLRIMRDQHSVCRAVLTEAEHDGLFGWLEAFSCVNDPDTLTGCRVECGEFPGGGDCLYTMPASLLVAVDYVAECSPTPEWINFDMFKEEVLYAGIHPS